MKRIQKNNPWPAACVKGVSCTTDQIAGASSKKEAPINVIPVPRCVRAYNEGDKQNA